MRKRGRPKKQNPLDEYIELRVTESEKKAFRDAAGRSGIPMATWIRERLRNVAIRELEKADLPVAFLE
jgi:predicted DNA binding CopG/RHH family protein